MRLISKFNEDFRFSLCVTDIYKKYASVIPLKKKVLQLLMLFKIFWKNLIGSQIKYGVNKSSEFYNRSMKSWLEKNEIDMYSTHNEGKSVIAERFKNKIHMYVILISKNAYTE